MKVGRRFTLDWVVESLMRGKDPAAKPRLRTALVTYLFHLRKHGYVGFEHRYRTPLSPLSLIAVLADLDKSSAVKPMDGVPPPHELTSGDMSLRALLSGPLKLLLLARRRSKAIRPRLVPESATFAGRILPRRVAE